jgi:hypothetical protein
MKPPPQPPGEGDEAIGPGNGEQGRKEQEEQTFTSGEESRTAQQQRGRSSQSEKEEEKSSRKVAGEGESIQWSQDSIVEGTPESPSWDVPMPEGEDQGEEGAERSEDSSAHTNTSVRKSTKPTVESVDPRPNLTTDPEEKAKPGKGSED